MCVGNGVVGIDRVPTLKSRISVSIEVSMHTLIDICMDVSYAQQAGF